MPLLWNRMANQSDVNWIFLQQNRSEKEETAEELEDKIEKWVKKKSENYDDLRTHLKIEIEKCEEGNSTSWPCFEVITQFVVRLQGTRMKRTLFGRKESAQRWLHLTRQDIRRERNFRMQLVFCPEVDECKENMSSFFLCKKSSCQET